MIKKRTKNEIAIGLARLIWSIVKI